MTDRERRRLKFATLVVKCLLEVYIAVIVTLLFVVDRCL